VIKPREKLLGYSTAMARGTELAFAGGIRKIIMIRSKRTLFSLGGLKTLVASFLSFL
jgi:hypothetical protein